VGGPALSRVGSRPVVDAHIHRIPAPFRWSHGRDASYRVKLIVTVTTTGTGTPFKSVGVYSH